MQQRCKSCLDAVIVSDEVIAQLIEEADETPELLVANEQYEARLQHCFRCRALQYGTTCMKNGALVHYRAKFSAATCPQFSWKDE